MADVLTDDLSPLYRSVRDQIDGARWDAEARTLREPSTLQTPADVQMLIASMAPEHGLDPRLVQAIMGLESGGQSGAVSRKGAQGLMQLMPATARRFGVRDPFDPKDNLRGGMRYLAYLQERFPGRVDLQLAAYHAGEGAVKKAGNAIPDTTDGQMHTGDYVRTILGRYQAAGGLYAGPDVAATQTKLPTPMEAFMHWWQPERPLRGGGPATLSRPDVQRTPAAEQQITQQPTLPLPGEAGRPPLDVSAEVQRHAIALGTPLQVETNPDVLTQRAVEMNPPPASFPRRPEPGLVETGGGGLLGGLAEGAIQMVRNTLEGVQGLSHYLGLRGPDDAILDPLNEKLVVPLLHKLEQSVAPRTGEQGKDFLDRLANAAGSSLMSLLPGAGVKAVFDRVAQLAPILSRTGGALVSGGLEAFAEAGSVYSQMAPLVGEEEAAKRAATAFGWNLAVVTLTDRLGIFGDAAKKLRYIGSTVAMNNLQEIVQYDVERRQLWVPATHAKAAALEQQGWERQGDRVVQPFAMASLGEVIAIATILGGATSGAGLALARAAEQQVPALHEAVTVAQETMPEATVETVLQAAQAPDAPPAGVEPGLWQRLGQGVLMVLRNERGAIGGQGTGGRTMAEIRALFRSIDEGGEAAQGVMQELGVSTPREAVMQLTAEAQRLAQEPAAETTPETPTTETATAPEAPTASPIPEEARQRALTLRVGAEGLTPDRYRTPSGGWRIPLRDMPSRELELLDFLRQQGGIRLDGEELRGEFEALVTRKETGLGGLQNNATGLSAQQMAERASEQGFLPTPDKASLLEALDRAVTQGQPVYSVYATGQVSLIDNPHVQASYQAVLDATAAMETRTEEQVGGVRHRPERHAEAQEWIDSGQWTLDDIRDIYPNTPLNDTQATALLISMNRIGEQMALAAQAYLDGGERIGSREERTLQEVMALFAELDPVRLGVSAAQARGLGILNNPNSGYTQFLNGLHEALRVAPERTMAQIARKVLAARPERALTTEQLKNNPELLADLWANHNALVAFQQGLEPLDPMRPGVQGELPFPKPEWMEADRWEHLRAEYAAMAQDEVQAVPSQPSWMPEDEWARLQQHYAAWEQERQGGEMLQGDPLFPGHGPWRTQAEWRAQAAAAIAKMDEAQRGRLAEALRPWQSQMVQQPLFRALAQSTRPGFQQYFLELWFNAMLSNPATHIANAISNASVTAWAVPERFVAEQFGLGRAGHVARGESAAMLYGLVHGLQDAWAVAVRSWQLSTPASAVGREYHREPVGTAVNLGLDPASPLGRLADFFFSYIGLASGGRLPTRALMASDEFFKMLNYRMELNALAYREASRMGLDGPAWAEQVARVVTTPSLAHLQEAAQAFSVMQTFQQALNPEGLGAKFQSLADFSFTVPWTSIQIPIGRVVLPFIQTPSNIARYTLERTPGGILFKSMQEDIAAGGERADTAWAKMSLGTIVMASFAGFALSGKLTGRAPEDPVLRDLWLKRHPEYSIKLFNGPWVSLSRVDPAGMLAGMVADMVQIAGESEPGLVTKGMMMLWYPFLKNIVSKTYMRSLSELLTAVSPNPFAKAEHSVARGARYTWTTLAKLAQPSSLLAATARALDPEERDIQEFWDALYARVPGWRDDTPARRTLGGEKVLYGYGFAPDFLANTVRAYWPLALGDGMNYLPDVEILKNRMDLSRVPRSLATRAVRPGEMAQITAENIDEYPTLKLSAREEEAFAVLAAGNQKEAEALGLKLPTKILTVVTKEQASQFKARPPKEAMSLDTFLDWMIQQPEYLAETQGPKEGRESMFERVIAGYRAVGKDLLLHQFPALNQRYEQTRIQRAVMKLPLAKRPEELRKLQHEFDRGRPLTREELGLPPVQTQTYQRIGVQ